VQFDVGCLLSEIFIEHSCYNLVLLTKIMRPRDFDFKSDYLTAFDQVLINMVEAAERTKDVHDNANEERFIHLRSLLMDSYETDDTNPAPKEWIEKHRFGIVKWLAWMARMPEVPFKKDFDQQTWEDNIDLLAEWG